MRRLRAMWRARCSRLASTAAAERLRVISRWGSLSGASARATAFVRRLSDNSGGRTALRMSVLACCGCRAATWRTGARWMSNAFLALLPATEVGLAGCAGVRSAGTGARVCAGTAACAFGRMDAAGACRAAVVPAVRTKPSTARPATAGGMGASPNSLPVMALYRLPLSSMTLVAIPTLFVYPHALHRIPLILNPLALRMQEGSYWNAYPTAKSKPRML